MIIKVYTEKFDDNFEPITDDFVNIILEDKEKLKKNNAIVFTIEISLDNQKFDDIFEIYVDNEKFVSFYESNLDITNEIYELLFKYIIENKTLKEIEKEMPNDLKDIINRKIQNEEQIWANIKKSIINKVLGEIE